jgi:hypothetical protein
MRRMVCRRIHAVNRDGRDGPHVMARRERRCYSCAVRSQQGGWQVCHSRVKTPVPPPPQLPWFDGLLGVMRLVNRNLAVRSVSGSSIAAELYAECFAPHAVGLFRFFGRCDLNLNGVNVVGLFGVHGHDSKTAVRAADLNGSGGLGSGRAWAHRVGS